MSLTMLGTITGGAITGFTTPGYVLVADNAPDVRSKQSACTSVTGTQVGVTSHTVNAPFTVTARRPLQFKTLTMAFLNGVTGQFSKVPYNETLILVRKAAQIALNQWQTNEWRVNAKIFAGTETYDPANVKAGVSFTSGFISTNSSGWADTLITGVL